MACRRSLDIDMLWDKRLLACRVPARYLFLGLRLICDDRGVFPWRTEMLDRVVIGNSGEHVFGLLTNLLEQFLISKFEVDGKFYGIIIDFPKFEHIDEPLALYPLPAAIIQEYDLGWISENRISGARVFPYDWKAIRERVFARNGERCRYCNDTDGPFQIDHIIPASRGGSDDMDNLAVACQSCNASKGNKTLEEWLS